MNRSDGIAISAAGIVVVISVYFIAYLTTFRTALDRCLSTIPLPAGAVLSENSLMEATGTLFPIGQVCRWAADDGGVVSSRFEDWGLSAGVIVAMLIVGVGVSIFLVASRRLRTNGSPEVRVSHQSRLGGYGEE